MFANIIIGIVTICYTETQNDIFKKISASVSIIE